MSYAELLAADRRLVILRILADSTGFCCNEHLLISLLETQGHVVSHDALRTELAWLDEQRLVSTQEVGGLNIATLTQRGADVSSGRSRAPGVKRPAPGG